MVSARERKRNMKKGSEVKSKKVQEKELREGKREIEGKKGRECVSKRERERDCVLSSLTGS